MNAWCVRVSSTVGRNHSTLLKLPCTTNYFRGVTPLSRNSPIYNQIPQRIQIKYSNSCLTKIPTASMCTLANRNPPSPKTEENVETNFKHTWVQKMPTSIQPYLLLARVDRPIGTWLLLWPCWWSQALAAGVPHGGSTLMGGTTGAGTMGMMGPGTMEIMGLQALTSLPVGLMGLFGLGAVLMRGAGCTFNDMVDKDIDVKVARTRTRPIAAGNITYPQAVTFLGLQLTGALAVLLSLNNYSIVLGASSLLVVACYPFMKRITWYPQGWLGLAFNWGALLGWSSVHGSLDLSVVLPLYVSGIAWTIIYDTIYAHMDKGDDLFLGIGSTAIKFGKHNKLILSSFGVICISSLLACGYAAGQTLPYYVAVGVAAAHLGWQIFAVRLGDGASCMRMFIANKYFGLILFLGILAGNFFKPSPSSPSVSSPSVSSPSVDHSVSPSPSVDHSLSHSTHPQVTTVDHLEKTKSLN